MCNLKEAKCGCHGLMAAEQGLWKIKHYLHHFMGTQLKLRDGVKNCYNSNKIMMDLELGQMGL